MLGDKDAAVTIAVKDLKVAKGFYEGTLGLKRIGAEDPDGLFYKNGNSQVFIYRVAIRRHEQGYGCQLGSRR